VSSRRLIDWRRRESARRAKEAAAVNGVPADALRAPDPAAGESATDRDDSLTLLFLCCHPALPHT